MATQTNGNKNIGCDCGQCKRCKERVYKARYRKGAAYQAAKLRRNQVRAKVEADRRVCSDRELTERMIATFVERGWD